MFFKRRKKKGPAGPEERKGFEDLRRHYRRAPNRKHALGVQLMGASFPPIPAEAMDVSAGGARLAFTPDCDPKFHENFEAELAFTSLVHEGQVRAPARLLRREEGEDGKVLYAFEFKDVTRLFEQVDPFFAKFFNRRRASRLRPALGARVPATLAIPDGGTPNEAVTNGATTEGGVDAALQDISLFGAGFTLTGDAAAALVEVERPRLTITVPGQEQNFVCHARRRHATARGSGFVLGYEFEDPQSEPGVDSLRKYVAWREDEIQRWEGTH
jgi:c-di-GMP-binding flagellar brake protein YcgR